MQEKLSHNAIILIISKLISVFGVKSDTELATVLGVKQNTISSWKSRRTIDYPLVIAKCDDVDLNWLFNSQDSDITPKMIDVEKKLQTKSTENVSNLNANKDANRNANKRKVQKTLANEEPKISPILKDDQERVATALRSEDGIPLIPLDAVAGFCSGNSVQVMEYECEKYIIPSFRGAEFLIQVKGSSMYPKYSSGDIVACKCLSLDTFFQWNKVYVIDTEQGVLIKRIRRGSDEEHITLISENERYEPFVLHRRDIHALAIVIGVIRLE